MDNKKCRYERRLSTGECTALASGEKEGGCRRSQAVGPQQTILGGVVISGSEVRAQRAAPLGGRVYQTLAGGRGPVSDVSGLRQA